MVDTQKKPWIWFVAVDGSERSHNAFDECYQEFYQPEDSIIVCTVTDKTKTYLPREYTADVIYNNYHTFLLSHVHESKYAIIKQEKSENSTIKDDIIAIADVKGANAIVVGYTGRKGVKADPTVMGSTVQHMVIKTKAPLFITKKPYSRAKSKTKGFTFMVCLDGSKKSEKGLELCKKIAHNPNDIVLACVVESKELAGKSAEVKQRFTEFLETNKLKGDYISVSAFKGIADEIIGYVNNNEQYDVDFVIMGNSGMRAQTTGIMEVGTVATSLITNINANVILLP